MDEQEWDWGGKRAEEGGFRERRLGDEERDRWIRFTLAIEHVLGVTRRVRLVVGSGECVAVETETVSDEDALHFTHVIRAHLLRFRFALCQHP